MRYKEKLLYDLFKKYKNKKIKILDIGSGTSLGFVKTLSENPEFHYTGIEYREKSIEKAKANLKGLNSTIVNGFGENQEKIEFESFDVVISLSVLEHVKYLQSFLEQTTKFLKKGGELIHSYDLGHAIYPSTVRERVKVFLCNNLPFLISKKHFTCYPNLNNIKDNLVRHNIKDIQITQHQMPSLKKTQNLLSSIENSDKLTTGIQNLEEEIFKNIQPVLAQRELDRLFPTILITGIKY